MIPLRRWWLTQASLDVAKDDELLDLMEASGCIGIFFGLETFTAESLAHANKRQNRVAWYNEAIARLHRRGIAVMGGLHCRLRRRHARVRRTDGGQPLRHRRRRALPERLDAFQGHAAVRADGRRRADAAGARLGVLQRLQRHVPAAGDDARRIADGTSAAVAASVLAAARRGPGLARRAPVAGGGAAHEPVHERLLRAEGAARQPAGRHAGASGIPRRREAAARCGAAVQRIEYRRAPGRGAMNAYLVPSALIIVGIALRSIGAVFPEYS